MHTQKVTLWSGDVNEPYFSAYDPSQTETVKGECYRPMITDYIRHEFEDIEVIGMWV